MPDARTLAAFLAGAVVALPGLALAQAPVETPPVETPPVDAPPDRDREDDPEVEAQDEAVEAQEEAGGDGRGEVVSALAGCLPSGAALHGTGLTKGFVMRQAHTGEVSLGEDTESLPLAEPADAAAVCAAVDVLVADVGEAPETARGRPDWARPNHDDEAAAPGAHGRGRAAKATADRGR